MLAVSDGAWQVIAASVTGLFTLAAAVATGVMLARVQSASKKATSNEEVLTDVVGDLRVQVARRDRTIERRDRRIRKLEAELQAKG